MSDRPRVPATEAGRALLNAWYPEDLSLADGEKGGMVEDIIAIEAEAALPSVDALARALADHQHPGSVGGTLVIRRDHLATWVDGFDCATAILAALQTPDAGEPVPDGQQLRQVGPDVTPQGGSDADGSATHVEPGEEP